MPQKRVQMRVGLFSLLALGLLTVGIVRLAGGPVFSTGDEYTLYFQGSVTGLSVGAPVVFRGVPLGKVTHISLMTTEHDDALTILVRIELEKGSIRRSGSAEGLVDTARDDMLTRMVHRGLRARITTTNYVTGQARVELDLLPASPARYHSTDGSREIPTLASPFEEFARALSRIDVERIAHNLAHALASFDKLISSEDLYGTLVGLKRLVDDTTVLTASAGKILQRLEPAADRMPGISHDMVTTLDSVSKAADRVDKFFLDTGRLMSPNAATVRELQNALKELTEAARAIRSLANNLERNPESLLRGRGRRQP